MKNKEGNVRKVKLYICMAIITAVVFVCAVVFPVCVAITASAQSFPFYDLTPKEIVLRSSFSTHYQKSSEARKWNIALATKSINKTLVDVGEEFSFNRTVGYRTEKRGYKVAKIIKDGIFTDGIGGGVCQVSTTLYNALLLADLKITEAHPHSLKVSYVNPSFDAMVNSGSSDLRFVNNTKNPIIIYGIADGNSLTFEVYGQGLDYTVFRESVVKETVSPPDNEIVYSTPQEYPQLNSLTEIVVIPPKCGLKSEGYIVKSKNGKVFYRKKIRNDYYKCIKGVVVKQKPQTQEMIPQEDNVKDN